MIRKDTAQDIERPHFYSQFWIDVASGKRDVSDAHAAVDTDLIGDETEDEELAAPPIDLVPKQAPKKAAKPEKKPEPARPTITSLADLANIDLLMKNSAEMEGDEVPDLEAGEMDDLAPFGQTEEETQAPVADFDFGEETPEAAQTEGEEDFGDDFEEDEEEDEWGGRRPGKPGKQQRPPRRERRPNF